MTQDTPQWPEKKICGTCDGTKKFMGILGEEDCPHCYLVHQWNLAREAMILAFNTWREKQPKLGTAPAPRVTANDTYKIIELNQIDSMGEIARINKLVLSEAIAKFVNGR